MRLYLSITSKIYLSLYSFHVLASAVVRFCTADQRAEYEERLPIPKSRLSNSNSTAMLVDVESCSRREVGGRGCRQALGGKGRRGQRDADSGPTYNPARPSTNPKYKR